MEDKAVKPIIDNNPVQRGIKRIIVFPPNVKHPKDKVVEGIEKIILKSFYATSKELAQAIRDNLAINEDEVRKIIKKYIQSCIAPNYPIVKKLATEITKGNIIRAKP